MPFALAVTVCQFKLLAAACHCQCPVPLAVSDSDQRERQCQPEPGPRGCRQPWADSKPDSEYHWQVRKSDSRAKRQPEAQWHTGTYTCRARTDTGTRCGTQLEVLVQLEAMPVNRDLKPSSSSSEPNWQVLVVQ